MSEASLPPEPGERHTRAGDADRKLTADRLKDALDEGRLDLSEYDERVQAAYLAKTYAELDELVADIPGVTPISKQALSKVDEPVVTRSGGDRPRSKKDRRLRELKGIWSGFGGALIFFTGLWAIGWISSGEMPSYWPMWIIGIWGIGALCATWSKFMND